MIENESLFHDIVEHLFDGAYFVDTERRITFWNKSAERLTGYKSKDVVGSSCPDNILSHVDEQGAHLCEALCPLAKTIKDGRPRESELYIRHKDGHRIPILVRIAAVKDKDKRIVGAIEIFSDNSSTLWRRERIAELERLALLDTLTGLPNRRYLERELESRASELERFGRLFGVLLMDVDGLGEVNRVQGRDVGDDVLRMIGQTFLYNTRPFDVVGRWDAGTFVGIIVNVDESDLARAAHRFQMLAGKSTLPRESGGVSVTLSIGATMAKFGDRPEELLTAADALLKQSKRVGKNRVTMGETGAGR
jgi:diguanylate cyclase (GGDEF)-like protein/PAS domain S-box-containing protein